MRYVAAYMLAALSSKEAPTQADIERILGSVGVDCDKEKCKQVIDAMKGKSVADLVESGQAKLASVPTGGGGAPAAAAAAAPAAAAAADTKKDAKETKKEEKKEESEDEDGDMGFGLFD